MGKFLVCVLVATASAMVAAQPQSPYYRGPSYRGLARDITDYGLFKLMSAIQGGGRGHRELLGAASSIRNSLLPSSSSSGSYSPYQQGKNYGYLAPPPRGSKSYYYNPSAGSSVRGQRPDFLKDTFIISSSGGSGSSKSKSPYSYSQAISASGPTEYSSDSEEYSPSSSSSSEYSSSGSSPYSSPISSSSPYSSPTSSSSPYSSPTSSPYSSPSSESSSVYSSSAPPSSLSSDSSGSSEYATSSSPSSSHSPGSGGSSTITVSSDEPLSLEQIVAKAAQEQHQKVLAREQQAHPGAQVTHQVRLAPQYQQSAGAGPQPGSLPQQYRQILIQAPGQPGQHPQQYSPQQYAIQGAPQQVLLRGPPPPPQFGGPNGPVPPHGQQIIIQGPNGQPMLLQLQPPQGQPQIQYVPNGAQPGAGQQIQYIQNPQQIRIAGQPGGIQGQQGQPQLIQYQPVPQQGFPAFPVHGQQYPGQQIYTLPGPHGFFPQQVPLAPEGLLGQPQFALPQQEQQQIQTNQIYNQPGQQQQQSQSSSVQQSTSSSEQSEQISSAESSVSVSTVEAPSASVDSPLSAPGDSDPMTAALLHSHTEYSEPVHKI